VSSIGHRFYPSPCGHGLTQHSHGCWRRLHGPGHACEPGLGCPPPSCISPLGYPIPARSHLIKPLQRRTSRQKASFCAVPIHHQAEPSPAARFPSTSHPQQRFPPSHSRGRSRVSAVRHCSAQSRWQPQHGPQRLLCAWGWSFSPAP